MIVMGHLPVIDRTGKTVLKEAPPAVGPPGRLPP